MKAIHSFQTALKALRTHQGRSALTILGIVIGITAIIVVMSLGQGASQLILGQIQSLGSKTVVIVPGREPKGPTDPSISETLLVDSLKDRELRELQKKEHVPTLKKIMPMVLGTATGQYKSETLRLTVLGADTFMQQIYDLQTSSGNFFTEEDVISRADVVVIGDKISEELFGFNQALNERIKIKGRNFRVVGVLPKTGQVSFFNFDDMVLMPYTTAQQYIFGIKYYHRLIVEADSEQNIGQTVSDITVTLRNLHNIEDPTKDDFHIHTQADLAETVGTIINTLTLFLVAVAGISLLVGGVGIMNIMLVSVTERTREIGLRKALGAKGSNILTQFLLEAVLLTGIGGVIGIALGALLAFAASLVLSRIANLNWSYAFPIGSAFIGLAVAASIGVVFGLYPAWTASKKSPMEALRYE